MRRPAQVFLRGFTLTLPLLTAVVPFGILYGTIATGAGFPWWLTFLCSVVVFGGSSQLIFIDLLTHLGSPFQATLGANIVNARHLIYSAGVSQRVSQFSLGWRLLISYFLTDQLYAISQAKEEEIRTIPFHLAPWFYAGSGFCTWFFWASSTLLGVGFGKLIPASWNLGFSIPLIFLPLVFAVAKTRFAYIACIFTLGFVVALREVPYGLGVFFSILLGSFLGYLAEKMARKEK